jgi:hypothetical protein
MGCGMDPPGIMRSRVAAYEAIEQLLAEGRPTVQVLLKSGVVDLNH